MSYAVLKTELKTGTFSLFSNKFDFVFKLNEDVIFKMKVSKHTLQEAYSEYASRLKDYQLNDLVISSTQEQGLGFIAISLEKSSKKKVLKSVEHLDISKLLDKEDYHFTLFYDLENPVVQPQELDRDIVFSAKAIDIQVLGKENSPSAVAIIFESPDLHNRFNKLQNIGLKYDFDEYLPHCSIIYEPTEKDIEIILAQKESIIKNIGTIELRKEHWRQAKKYY